MVSRQTGSGVKENLGGLRPLGRGSRYVRELILHLRRWRERVIAPPPPHTLGIPPDAHASGFGHKKRGVSACAPTPLVGVGIQVRLRILAYPYPYPFWLSA